MLAWQLEYKTGVIHVLEYLVKIAHTAWPLRGMSEVTSVTTSKLHSIRQVVEDRCPLFSSENQRDKNIARDDEYSDSEDEGDDRRDEQSYREIKRPRLTEDPKPVLPKSVTGNQVISSPLPPEPSPITPLPQEDGTATTTAVGKQSGL